MNNSNPSNNILIKHIEQANWFRSMDHYPKTVDHLKLLISIVDRIGVFNNFELAKTSDMNKQSLNIMYAILRITNKVFNKYSDYVVKKIFVDQLKQLFKPTPSDTYDFFMDQLIQDIDYFVSLIIKSHYPKLDINYISGKFITYLQTTFKNSFYMQIVKKLNYDIDDVFYIKYDQLIKKIIKDFVRHTISTLHDTYDTMIIFLGKIFDHQCSDRMIHQIIVALKKYIDLDSLFKEQCMEIDVYCDQKLDDDHGTDKNSKKNSNKNPNKNSNNNFKLKEIGYQIYQNNSAPTILQPFVDHQFVKTTNILLDAIIKILSDYQLVPGFMDKSIKDLQNSNTKTINLSPNIPPEFIFHIISRLLDIKIVLMDSKLSSIAIDNTRHRRPQVVDDNDHFHQQQSVVIYLDNQHMYYTLYPINESFIPVSFMTFYHATEILDLYDFHNEDELKPKQPKMKANSPYRREIIEV